jgi:hypothetical protein
VNFIITTKDASQAHKSWQKNWPEKLHHINSRSFKKSFNQTEYEKLKINWVINKYLGKAPERDLLFSYQGRGENNDYCIPTISIQTVSEHLAKVTTIDNEYVPEEGDELKVYIDYHYKVINGVKRPNIDFRTIALIYKGNKWEKGNYDFDCDETRFHLRGIIEV